MTLPPSRHSYVLAEWYRRELAESPIGQTAATLDDAAVTVSAGGPPVQLLALLAVPNDSVLFAVFSAESVQSVAQACDRAGLSAERLTVAGDLHLRKG
jgi:hypothetical protein